LGGVVPVSWLLRRRSSAKRPDIRTGVGPVRLQLHERSDTQFGLGAQLGWHGTCDLGEADSQSCEVDQDANFGWQGTHEFLTAGEGEAIGLEPERHEVDQETKFGWQGTREFLVRQL
jgi:SH3-like domain-containing protein